MYKLLKIIKILRNSYFYFDKCIACYILFFKYYISKKSVGIICFHCTQFIKIISNK